MVRLAKSGHSAKLSIAHPAMDQNPPQPTFDRRTGVLNGLLSDSARSTFLSYYGE
jgi:hypothetical protein